jgi:hypothetical protein
MALIITKSSAAQTALKLITDSGIDATERLDGIEVADSDSGEASDLLRDEYIVHVIEY